MEINSLSNYASYIDSQNTSTATTGTQNSSASDDTTSQQTPDSLQQPSEQIPAVQLEISQEAREAASVIQQPTETNLTAETPDTVSATSVDTFSEPTPPPESPEPEVTEEPALQQQTLETTLTRNNGVQAYALAGAFAFTPQNSIDKTL